MPRFPLYIPSKSRADSRLTVRALQEQGVDFRVIVEEQQWDQYAAVIPERNLLILDPEFQRKYDTLDDLGDTKSKGPGPARNFAWEHAISEGHAWHWVMDDNIKGFYRFNRNLKTPCTSPAFWRAQEDFVLRYENVAMAGPNYFMFQSRKCRAPAFVLNTRIYSCNLIRNDLPHRWRGRYNEDTILSIDMMKDDWCTVQFNAFLQYKMTTQTIKGGNHEAFYEEEGTLPKSEMLCRVHPDISKISWRFKRWHHHVNYDVFKQRLKFAPGVYPRRKRDEYGMQLQRRDDAGQWFDMDPAQLHAAV